MSRRRGEFEHRTSIFEGAFRAWSHLGGLEPEALESQPAADLDPLTHPLDHNHDTRLSSGSASAKNPDGSTRREYPYEPLPRSGLAHPYVQAILSPWLGPDADNEAIQLGLTTLRTWWQHRRKGESGSAIAALGTEKMKGVVEGYTRHFFTLAHCLVMNDKEQPPRTLHTKMKELEKLRSKRNKKRGRENDPNAPGTAPAAPKGAQTTSMIPNALAAGVSDVLQDEGMSPLERLHQAQRRQLAEAGGLQTPTGAVHSDFPIINIKGKCIPGNVDLPGVLEAVNRQATQLAHRGGLGGQPSAVPSAVGSDPMAAVAHQKPQYGDPNTTPVVFVNAKGDIQIAMSVDGITCAHCVKIVETVLKGCNGNKSPIEGLLDAAADRALHSILIKIDKASSAKRISFEAARNLAMVGYTAKAMEMSIVGEENTKARMDLGALSTAFEVVASSPEKAKDLFDWSLPCTCPDNGVMREDCARHSQMHNSIFQAFESRMQEVTDYMAGCGMKYGMACTCGPECRCKNCPIHSPNAANGTNGSNITPEGGAGNSNNMGQGAEPLQPNMFGPGITPVEQPTMAFFGMEPPAPMNNMALQQQQKQHAAPVPASIQTPAPAPHDGMQPHQLPLQTHPMQHRQSSHRNPSILSYGNGLRGMSITSETTFGRAMSGLSALSIDWENLGDEFDLEVDHSAHINNQGYGQAGNASGGPRRSSIRRSHLMNNSNNNNNDGEGNTPTHVSFRV